MKSSATASRQIRLSLDRPLEIIVSCEHGGCHIPGKYARLFRGRKGLLNTHRSHDPGSRFIAEALAKALGARLHYSTTSRLLVDLNRSLGHPKLFSEISRTLAPSDKTALLEGCYKPYRSAVESFIAGNIGKGRHVLHISVHTFTPVFRGVGRKADLGLLYDPSRSGERALCVSLQKTLTALNSRLIVRRNYPYLGTADGFITYLRKRFPQAEYTGIELEVNQKYFRGDTLRREKIRSVITKGFNVVLSAKYGGSTSIFLS
jgi:predicted N-formylglutamate amidohydrolase